MMKSTRLRALSNLDSMNLDKYLTYGFDGKKITGINNTNLIIFVLYYV